MEPLKIFISYASEDVAIAAVFERGLREKLAPTLEGGIDIVQDVHSFSFGSSLKDDIITELEKANVLFVIYTERLKKSHSYTGFEIGAFRAFMYKEAKQLKEEVEHKPTIGRRIVSLYFDDLPDSEKDILGIQLDLRALVQPEETRKIELLDPSDSLQKFFYEILELYARRTVDDWNKDISNKAKELFKSKKSVIDTDMIPEVKAGLVKALSSLIASSSVEQLHIELKWRSSIQDPANEKDVLSGCELEASKPDAFRIFGIFRDSAILSWDDFRSALFEDPPKQGGFILRAIEDAVRSALRVGPVDNDQIFCSQTGDLYRIIITRHYLYFDGRKHMNMYLIPMLNRYSDKLPLIVLALLNVASRYKVKFLAADSKYSITNYEMLVLEPESFVDMTRRHLREFFLIEDESHVYRLDDPLKYREYYGDASPPIDIVQKFREWKEKRLRFVTLANEVIQAPISADNTILMKRWIEELQNFNEYIAPMNKQVGSKASDRLRNWFDAGQFV
jgi:hypothetical protein